MGINIAPLQTYEGPELDPIGSFLQGQKGALMREEMQMERDEVGRKNAARQSMQGILSKMGDNPDLEAAALEMLPIDPEMASTLIEMETHRQRGALQAQDMELQSVKIAQERINTRKAQIELETKTAMGAVRALEGVEEPSQKQRIYSLYLQSVEDQGMEVPQDLKTGWTPENEQNLKDIAELGQMMIDLDPASKTAEIRNFEYGQQNPEFGEFYKDANKGSISPEQQAWEIFHSENPGVPYKDFMSQYRKGITGASLGEDGITPIEGAKEAVTTMADAEAEGKETGKATGEAKAKFEDLKSNMPNLVAKTDKLYKLADIATYNSAGKLRDAFLREAGVEVSDAAEARAATIAIIDNEVLPILRQTFGAAFTVAEGEWLKATMGNPDMSPKEKKAQIDAFVEGKKSELETLARRTGQEAPNVEPNTGRELEKLSDEELEEMLKNAE